MAGQLGRFASSLTARTFQTSYQIDELGPWYATIARQLPCAHRSERTFPMNRGTVKFYNDQKGFGFIQPDDGAKDVFVHATALERAGIQGLREGQKVKFDTQNDPRSGKIAVSAIEIA
jgi:CspA family cold shock protein